MRRLPLQSGAVAGSFAGYNTLGCLLDPADLARTYAEVRRLLAPGAPFLFDVPVPGAAEPYEASGPPRKERWELPDGGVIERTATILDPPEQGRIRLEYAYRWRGATGGGGSETVLFQLNTWPPAFYAEQAEAAGFSVARIEQRTFHDRRGRERAWAFVETRTTMAPQ